MVVMGGLRKDDGGGLRKMDGRPVAVEDDEQWHIY